MYKYYVVECSRVNDDEFMTGVVDLEAAETVAMSMWDYMHPYDRRNKYTEVTGNMYSAIAIEEDFYEPTMACSERMV